MLKGQRMVTEELNPFTAPHMAGNHSHKPITAGTNNGAPCIWLRQLITVLHN